jgi:tripartite-type tricarboxylate transporter receptor subunit TctC
MAESGLPGVIVDNWFGILVPSRAPPVIQERLKAAVRAAQSDPEYLTGLDKHASTINEFGPEAFATLLREEHERWVPMMRLVDPKTIQ